MAFVVELPKCLFAEADNRARRCIFFPLFDDSKWNLQIYDGRNIFEVIHGGVAIDNASTGRHEHVVATSSACDKRVRLKIKIFPFADLLENFLKRFSALRFKHIVNINEFQIEFVCQPFADITLPRPRHADKRDVHDLFTLPNCERRSKSTATSTRSSVPTHAGKSQVVRISDRSAAILKNQSSSLNANCDAVSSCGLRYDLRRVGMNPNISAHSTNMTASKA